MKMKNVWYYDFPTGTMGIAQENDAITHIFFKGLGNFEGFEIKETQLIKRMAEEIEEYFAGKRRSFDIPLSMSGTDFQRSVWKALQTIPFGETRSYKDIATQIGNPKACRAVGMANNRNPVAIVVPCHRVIGQDGSMTGYAGGISVKEYLLDVEKRNA